MEEEQEAKAKRVTRSKSKTITRQINMFTELREGELDALSNLPLSEQRKRIILQHRQIWKNLSLRTLEELEAGNFNKLKNLKISSEILRIVQGGERIAWGLDKDKTDGGGNMSIKWAE